jgi:hypothetical protein
MKSKALRALRVAGGGVLAAWLAAPALGADDADVHAHWMRWKAAGPSSYEYGYNKYCECHRDTPPETVVTVDAGSVTRVYHKYADSAREVPAREGSLDLYWTIDDLFTLIEAATAHAATVRVRYDETLGYPTAVFIDYDAALIGEELDVRLTRFSARTP